MKFGKFSCPHPLFRYSSPGAWSGSPGGLIRPYVFVFERCRFLTPTAEQLADYRVRSGIVEGLGGHMDKKEWECAGEAPPLSLFDVKKILLSVKKAHPDATVIQHWNGEGCYTMSVGVDFKRPTTKEK